MITAEESFGGLIYSVERTKIDGVLKKDDIKKCILQCIATLVKHGYNP